MYRHVNRVRGRIVDEAMQAAAELRKDIDMLPNVAGDGTTDCPFAEELYYRKERTAAFVRDDLRDLKRALQGTNEAIASLENKGDGLADQREALHGGAAQDRFAAAETSLRSRVTDLQRERQELLEAIAELEATLREADARKYPGGDPRGPFGKTVYSQPQVRRPIEEIAKGNAKEAIERIRRSTRDQ